MALTPPPAAFSSASAAAAAAAADGAASAAGDDARHAGERAGGPAASTAPHVAAPPTGTPLAIDVVIPAFDEEASLPLVLRDLRALPPGLVRRVVVADNNSRDRTAEVAREAGAIVVPAPRQGYGSACLAALAEVRRVGPPDVVVFLDADHSDHPEELPAVVAPIVAGRADFVIGSRVLGRRERGAMLPQARFGNWLACALIRAIWGHRFTDLGPFRAARWEAFEALAMADADFGWTVELQVKAVEGRWRIEEVPVSYRRRVGVSKITGTISGTVRAGIKILSLIARHWWRGKAGRRRV